MVAVEWNVVVCGFRLYHPRSIETLNHDRITFIAQKEVCSNNIFSTAKLRDRAYNAKDFQNAKFLVITATLLKISKKKLL